MERTWSNVSVKRKFKEKKTTADVQSTLSPAVVYLNILQRSLHRTASASAAGIHHHSCLPPYPLRIRWGNSTSYPHIPRLPLLPFGTASPSRMGNPIMCYQITNSGVKSSDSVFFSSGFLCSIIAKPSIYKRRIEIIFSVNTITIISKDRNRTVNNHWSRSP